LPTNLQNFTQKDLTAVKIFQKVLGGLLFSETPCSYNEILIQSYVLLKNVIENNLA